MLEICPSILFYYSKWSCALSIFALTIFVLGLVAYAPTLYCYFTKTNSLNGISFREQYTSNTDVLTNEVKLPKLSTINSAIAAKEPLENDNSPSAIGSIEIANEIKLKKLPLQAKSEKFEVYCESKALAEIMLKEAEILRDKIAVLLTGEKLENCELPQKLIVQIDRRSGGVTTTKFKMDQVEMPKEGKPTFSNISEYERYFNQLSNVSDTEIIAFGSDRSIKESILPHEISHSILHQLCRTYPPLWANEGLASFNETNTIRDQSRANVMIKMKNGEDFSIRKLFDVYSYPNSQTETASFYDQSTVVSEFLIRDKGIKVFTEVVKNVCEEHSKSPLYKISALAEDQLRSIYCPHYSFQF